MIISKIRDRDFETLWTKYENLVNSIGEESISRLIEEQGQRIIECSYSQKTTEPFCGPGGIIEFMLELAKASKNISAALDFDIDLRTLIKVCLLSEIGRIGNLTQDRFVASSSDWHKEKLGQYYDWNEFCERYNVYDMTLWYSNHYNIDLSWEEWLAISLLKNNKEDDQFYQLSKSSLSIVLKTAKEVVIKNEMNRINESRTSPF